MQLSLSLLQRLCKPSLCSHPEGTAGGLSPRLQGPNLKGRQRQRSDCMQTVPLEMFSDHLRSKGHQQTEEFFPHVY